MRFNIKQTNIMEFLTDKFNTNSFGIPFKQGFYASEGGNDLNIVWYKPKLNDKGLFDIEDTYNSETYASNKKRFLVMQTDVSSGDYVGLPDIEMASYTSNIEIMVYAEDPLSLITSKMAIEEIRDSFIGSQYLHQVEEKNLDSIDEVYYKIVTTAGGIDYGSEIILKGRKFLIMSFQVDLTVSKNVDFGNQVEWEIAKYNTDGTLGTYVEVVPLISSWGVSHEMMSQQTLNSLNLTNVAKSREVHNYVKSRGFGLTFTFFKSNNSIIRTMYAESSNVPELPPLYSIKKKELEYDASGNSSYPSDLQFTKKCVYGEVAPADIIYGEPIIFAIGFVVSSK